MYMHEVWKSGKRFTRPGEPVYRYLRESGSDSDASGWLEGVDGCAYVISFYDILTNDWYLIED